MKNPGTVEMLIVRLIRMVTIPFGILFFEMYRKYYATFFFDDERLNKYIFFNSEMGDFVFNQIKKATDEQISKCKGIDLKWVGPEKESDKDFIFDEDPFEQDGDLF